MQTRDTDKSTMSLAEIESSIINYKEAFTDINHFTVRAFAKGDEYGTFVKNAANIHDLMFKSKDASFSALAWQAYFELGKKLGIYYLFVEEDYSNAKNMFNYRTLYAEWRRHVEANNMPAAEALFAGNRVEILANANYLFLAEARFHVENESYDRLTLVEEKITAQLPFVDQQFKLLLTESDTEFLRTEYLMQKALLSYTHALVLYHLATKFEQVDELKAQQAVLQVQAAKMLLTAKFNECIELIYDLHEIYILALDLAFLTENEKDIATYKIDVEVSQTRIEKIRQKRVTASAAVTVSEPDLLAPLNNFPHYDFNNHLTFKPYLKKYHDIHNFLNELITTGKDESLTDEQRLKIAASCYELGAFFNHAKSDPISALPLLTYAEIYMPNGWVQAECAHSEFMLYKKCEQPAQSEDRQNHHNSALLRCKEIIEDCQQTPCPALEAFAYFIKGQFAEQQKKYLDAAVHYAHAHEVLKKANAQDIQYSQVTYRLAAMSLLLPRESTVAMALFAELEKFWNTRDDNSNPYRRWFFERYGKRMLNHFAISKAKSHLEKAHTAFKIAHNIALEHNNADKAADSLDQFLHIERLIKMYSRPKLPPLVRIITLRQTEEVAPSSYSLSSRQC